MPQFDLSRDFLDGVFISQPQVQPGTANPEIRAGGQLHFLPSSPDGTMHTAIVAFGLTVGASDKPFANGAWRFLFTTDEKFDPRSDQENPFFGQLLVLGAGKIMAILNNLAMHANLPLIPFEPQRMMLQRQQPPAGDQQSQPPQQAKA
jgi:hypothetical protein